MTKSCRWYEENEKQPQAPSLAASWKSLSSWQEEYCFLSKKLPSSVTHSRAFLKRKRKETDVTSVSENSWRIWRHLSFSYCEEVAYKCDASCYPQKKKKRNHASFKLIQSSSQLKFIRNSRPECFLTCLTSLGC